MKVLLIAIAFVLLFVPMNVYSEISFEPPKLEKSIHSTTNGTYTRDFSQITYLDIDSRDNVYIVDQGNLYVISPNDEFVSNWYIPGSLWNIQINSKDDVYVSTSREPYSIHKLSSTGKIIETWNIFDSSDVKIDFIGDNAFQFFIDKQDNLYISEILRDEKDKPIVLTTVKKYSQNGNLINTINNVPSPMIQDSQGNFYGRTNKNIIKFNSQGNHLLEFGGYVVDLAIDKYDVIFATRGSQKTPVLFTTDGNPFLNFGGIGIGDEKFREPRGIGVNSNGRIYVIDYGKTNLLIFSPYVGIPDPERSIDLTFNEKEAQQRYDAQVYENYLKYEEAIKAGYTQQEIIASYEKQNTQQQTTEGETLDSEEEIICGKGTILKDGFCIPERETMTTEMQQKSSGGGCLIATATFGSELAPQVQQLREIRDNSLLQTQSGRSFMESFNQFYYSFSPTIADLERENPVFKEVVKLTITPLLTSLSLLNYVNMDSESQVLGYGISLILLNVGMYFVLPAIVIHRIKKLA